MNRRRWTVALLLAQLGIGCARIAAPPGGPPDRTPPVLLSTVPDSLAVYRDFKGDAEFRFDEVISEGGSPNFGLGSGDLERMIILSPSAGVPVVHWKRSRITVHPREGWKPNTVYRIELLPGLADLRSNRSKNGRVITFSTGGPLPTQPLSGLVVDWTTQRPMSNALVEAVLLPDSLPYRTTTDSAGRFSLDPMPLGDYIVFAVQDANTNRKREARESFDSVRVPMRRAEVGELWVFKHDTTAARITTAAINDSLSLVLTFSQMLNPYQRLPADSVEVKELPDSVAIPVLAILPKGPFDTAFPPSRTSDTARARADSLRARADSIRADSAARARAAAAIRIPGAQRRPDAPIDTTRNGPLKTKPPIFDKLYVRLGRRLTPAKDYVVVVHGIQNLTRVPGLARGVARIPVEKPPPDSTKAPADSTKKPRL